MMNKEEVIKTLKVHRKHCRDVGDKVYADALDYAIQYLSKEKQLIRRQKKWK